MPTSSPYGRDKIIDFLQKKEFHRVIDFGAGDGFYGRMIRAHFPKTHITAVEVWQPNIEKFELKTIYDEVLNADLRSLPFAFHPADLAIFGDVIEHMTREDALVVLREAKRNYKSIIINIPLGEYKQGAFEGNPYEEHKSTWEWRELVALLSDFYIRHKEKNKGIFIRWKI